MDLQEAALATDGTAVAALYFQSVSTDPGHPVRSASCRPAPLRRTRVRHGLAAQGAVAAMVDRARAATNLGSLAPAGRRGHPPGLGQLAAGWRSRFELPLIGITGSERQTTVKEMCAEHPAGAGPHRRFRSRPCRAGHQAQLVERHRPVTDAAAHVRQPPRGRRDGHEPPR